MSFDFTIFLYLGIALVSAKILGEIFEKIKLSSIVGELLAGFLFGGPIFLLFSEGDYTLGNFHFSFELMKESIEPFAQIGIILLLFIVGSQIRTSEIRKAGKRNLLISLTDVSITYSLGFLISYLIISLTKNYHNILGLSQVAMAAFLALIFVPTSIGTTVRSLSNMKKLNSKEGQTLLSLAVFDDFLALFFLLIVSGILFTDTASSTMPWYLNLVIQIVFIAVLLVAILYLLPKLFEFLEGRFYTFSLASTSYFTVGIVLAILLTTAFFAEYLGVSAAIGAFLLGVGMQRNRVITSDPLETFIKIGEGSLIPLFFFSVGSTFVLGNFNPVFLLLIPLAILAKMTGAFTGASFSTYSLKDFISRKRQLFQKKGESDSLEEEVETEQEEMVEKAKTMRFKKWWKNSKPNLASSGKIAIGMMPKGEITLVIAAIGLAASQDVSNEMFQLAGELYSIIILLVLVTVFLTPILLKLAFREIGEK